MRTVVASDGRSHADRALARARREAELRATADAEPVVLDSRGAAAARAVLALLGPVSQQCPQHARGPVVGAPAR